MPPHKKTKYLLTMVDNFSGWVEAFPMTHESADVMAIHLLKSILPNFGFLLNIKSDVGQPSFPKFRKKYPKL